QGQVGPERGVESSPEACRMGRLMVFVLAGALGAAGAWVSRSVRTSEADLLPLLAPSSRSASIDELEPAPLAAPPPKAAPAPVPAPVPAPAAAAPPAPEVSWTIEKAQSVLRLTPDGEWVDVAPGGSVAVGD